VRIPPKIELILGVALLDYSLFVWHVLTHRVRPLFWLHRIHHADLDLDVSTALRFHAFEMLASVPFRLVQVVTLGASPEIIRAWQRLLVISIGFHHSNARLPEWLDSGLARFVMTPRLHGIHHSIAQSDQNSNYSSGLTLWDAERM
jgi:sterol desaturase/sphingolipid hydroxylase (fatty acid hydroxylase superfamily)